MSNVYSIYPLVNRGTEDRDTEKEKTVSKKHLINKLNHLNFQEGTVLINLRHTKYNRTVSLKARPQPCLGDRLECLWTETTGLHHDLKSYEFQEVVVTEGKKTLLVKSELISIDEKGINLLLPETCCEVTSQKMVRYLCEGITVQLIQNSAVFPGSLIDFNPVCFRVEVMATPPETFQWINPESPVYLIVSDGLETLYSGDCEILRQASGQKRRAFVLKPVNERISRFKSKEFPSPRQQLTPSPDMVFRHPFTKKPVNLKVFDLSGSGFSVQEDEGNSVLLPGMIIPELELNFADTFKLKCGAQVVNRTIVEDEGEQENLVRCGLVLLNVNIEHHVKLLALLQQAKDSRSYLCTDVDLDALWNFFFETGFIYPEKYAFIQANKEKIKETYENLYARHPNIARHFIYQDKGVILGHNAMLRFCENTWLIHHHAANTSASNKAGLAVLNQIGHFVNDSYYLYSMHLGFLILYFRPENRFPNRVFGGAARYIKDPKGCSLDPFAYLHYQKRLQHGSNLPKPWKITDAQSEDLLELGSLYEHLSGGLMIQALDLEPGMHDCDELSKEYEQFGFRRERNLYSLKKDGSLKAVVIENISDIGFNMSDLTNCIKGIVLDEDDLTKDILYLTLSILSDKFDQDKITILLYPVTYARNQCVSYEKVYDLWVLNLQYLDHWFKFRDALFRRMRKR